MPRALSLCHRARGVWHLPGAPRRVSAGPAGGKYGPETPLDEVLARISADCPYQRGPARPGDKVLGQYVPRCHAFLPDIARPVPHPPDLPPSLMRPRLVSGGKG